MKSNNFSKLLEIKNMGILLFLSMFFVLDRYLKILAINLKGDFVLIKNILSFTFYPNENISFSLPLEGPGLIFLIGILILLILLYLIKAFKKGNFYQVFAWTAIILGALSNLIDRFKYSFVVDYLDLAHFTVLNFADLMISCGCLYIIFSNLLKKEIKK